MVTHFAFTSPNEEGVICGLRTRLAENPYLYYNQTSVQRTPSTQQSDGKREQEKVKAARNAMVRMRASDKLEQIKQNYDQPSRKNCH